MAGTKRKRAASLGDGADRSTLVANREAADAPPFVRTTKAYPEKYLGIVFSDNYDQFACQLCSPKLRESDYSATNRRISNINAHVDTKSHKHKSGADKQNKLTFAKTKDGISQTELDSMALRAVIECNMPFSAFEQDALKDLVLRGRKYNGKDLTLPGRKTIARRVVDQYDKTVTAVSELVVLLVLFVGLLS